MITDVFHPSCNLQCLTNMLFTDFLHCNVSVHFISSSTNVSLSEVLPQVRCKNFERQSYSLCVLRIKKSQNTKCIPGRIIELYPRYHPH